jgi:hypothetical protein
MKVRRRDGRAFHLDDTLCFGRDGKIIQLVGAQPNWTAVFRRNGVESSRAIACWALVEDCNGFTRVAGVDPEPCGDGNVEARLDFDHYQLLSFVSGAA